MLRVAWVRFVTGLNAGLRALGDLAVLGVADAVTSGPGRVPQRRQGRSGSFCIRLSSFRILKMEEPWQGGRSPGGYRYGRYGWHMRTIWKIRLMLHPAIERIWLAPHSGLRDSNGADNHVLDWFRQQVDDAGGGNYQTLINDAFAQLHAAETGAAGGHSAARDSR
jgi:hypothetical protein